MNNILSECHKVLDHQPHHKWHGTVISFPITLHGLDQLPQQWVYLKGYLIICSKLRTENVKESVF
jgi:hypothetical protein